MKKLLLFFTVLFFVCSQFTYATDYYTAGSQDPTNVNNWWTGTNGTGSHPPNFTTAGNLFYVQNGHSMTPTVLWTVSGTGSKVIIKTGGTVTSGAFNHSLTLDMEAGGTWIHSNTTYSSLTFGTLNAASNFQLNNASGFAATRTYPNLILNGVTVNPGASGITLNGNLDIRSAGIFRGTTTGTPTHSIAGDILIATGGTWTMSNGAGTPTYSISGTITNSGGTIGSSTGNTTINLNGSNSVTLNLGTPSNTNFNINVASTKTVTLGSNVATSLTFTNNGILDCSTFNITGAGTFAMASSNATLRIGSSAGLETGASGNIQTTTKTFNFSGTGNTFVYNGSSSQATGSLLTGTIRNLTISNATGATLTGSVSISGTASVTGLLILGTNNMTQSGGAATLSGNGIIRLDGVLGTQIGSYSSKTFNTTGTYQFNGAGQSIPTDSYFNVTVNGGGASMGGDVTVTGTLSLNGTLTVGANTLTISNPIANTITNLSTSSSSSMVVDGTAPSIHIPSTVTALTNLTINSNQLVTADAGITVSGIFTLGGSSFVLDMGSNTLEIGTSTATLGTLTRTTGGSVRGTMKRWLSTSTSSLLFPLNNNSADYVGATVNFSTLPTTGGSLTAKYTSSGAGSMPSGYIDFSAQYPGVNLINLSPQFWTITDGDGLSGFAYGLDLEATNMGLNTSTPMIVYTAIVKRNTGGGNTWAWNNSNHVTTSGTGSLPIAHCQGYTSFSDFAIAGNIDNLLPVELSSFTSSVSGRDITLSWTTTDETNNSGFDIERKSTTGNWIKLGNVEGHGTVNTPQSYSFVDRNLSSGRFSYRLKQIDYNGNYHYYNLSGEISIGTPSKYTLSQNYPNPFNPVTTISYEIPKGDFVALKVYDLTGKEVASLVNEKQEAGFYSVRFDGAKLSSGVYFYTLKSNDFVSTKKLILLK